MDDLLDRLRAQIDHATSSIDPSEVRTSRSWHRSRRLNVAAVVALLAVVAGVIALRSDPTERRPAVTVSVPAVPDDLGRSVERLVARTVGGATEVDIQLDGALPVGEATYVDDITAIQDPPFAFTTQSMEGTVWQCATRHFGFGPGAVGRSTIDVLIPSHWIDPDGVQPRDGGLTSVGDADVGKIMACGPYKGYIQYTITAPRFDGPGDVSVFVDGDTIRVLVQPPAP